MLQLASLRLKWKSQGVGAAAPTDAGEHVQLLALAFLLRRPVQLQPAAADPSEEDCDSRFSCDVAFQLAAWLPITLLM